MSEERPPSLLERFDAGQVWLVVGMVMVAVAGGLLFLKLTAPPPPPAPGSHHTLDSPYIAMPFQKGQPHVMSNRSVGQALPRDLAREYERLGYRWVSITDLNTLTTVDQYDTPGITGTNGALAQYGFGSFLAYGLDVIRPASSPQEAVDAIRGQAGVAYLANAAASPTPPYEQVAALRGLAGVEIYNARLALDAPASADATALWDRLLSDGHRLWGIVGDDALRVAGGASTVGRTSVDVQVVDVTAPLVNDALSRGAFFDSTGERLLGVSTEGDAITVVTVDADEVSFIGKGGGELAKTTGNRGVYHVRWNEGYVRAVATRKSDGARAWTQPVFVNP